VDDTAAVPATAPVAAAPVAAAGATAGAAPKAAAAAASPAAGSGRGGGRSSGAPPARETGVRASPAAERLAVRQGVDLAGVAGTGRGGVVSKADVIEQSGRAGQSGTRPAAPAPPTGGKAPAPPAPNGARSPQVPAGVRETRETMSTRRKRIAENLVQAQHTTAHLTTFNEIDMSAVSGLRDRIRDRVEREQGVKLSYMPFFVKAACLALRQYPTVNAQIDGDAIVYKHYVHMGIAVAAEQGLVVPVVRDADTKGMIDVAREIAELAVRARSGKLTIEDLTGGTFTITNGGVFGSLVSTPILNYPQSGILGLHKIQERPIALNGQVVIRPMMYVALSYDHRLVEGQQAVQFLVRIKELIEDPGAMAVG